MRCFWRATRHSCTAPVNCALAYAHARTCCASSPLDQEVEIEAARWMPLPEYQATYFQKGVALYEKTLDRCVAWAEGRYSGWVGLGFPCRPGPALCPQSVNGGLAWGPCMGPCIGGLHGGLEHGGVAWGHLCVGHLIMGVLHGVKFAWGQVCMGSSLHGCLACGLSVSP